MLDHELELLAALAEGRLEDETEARALIASSPDARAEYEAQKTAHDALSAMGPASLSDVERAELHRDTWTELRSRPTSRQATGRWYSRWTPVVAGLFVLVGVVAVLNQTDLSGSGADSSEEALVAASDVATVTTAAAAIAEPFGRTADGEETTEAPLDEGTADIEAQASPSNATAAFYSSEAELIRAGDEADSPVPLSDYSAEEPELEACLDRASLVGYVVHGVYEVRATSEGNATEVPEGPFIVSIPEGANLQSAPITFVDLDTCEVSYVDE